MEIAHLDGADIAYDVVGSAGPAVLLCHGGWGGSHHPYAPYLRTLADDHRVILHDYRGHGESPPCPMDGVTLSTYASDAVALCNHLGIDEVVVLGHSFGTWVASELVVRHPDSVVALVLGGGSPAWDFPEAIVDMMRARDATEEELAAWDRLSRHDFSNAATDSPLIGRFYVFSWPEGAPRPPAGPMPSGAVVLHDAALEQELTVATRLGEIRVPTLVFDGRHDFCAPPDLGGARFVAAIPSARHVIFENSSHIPYAEEPDRWTDVVREFIRSVCSTAA